MQGMDVNTNVYRPANFIEGMLKNFRTVTIAALALLALLLVLFFFDLRAALIGLHRRAGVVHRRRLRPRPDRSDDERDRPSPASRSQPRSWCTRRSWTSRT
jgi:hypothetical protein